MSDEADDILDGIDKALDDTLASLDRELDQAFAQSSGSAEPPPPPAPSVARFNRRAPIDEALGAQGAPVLKDKKPVADEVDEYVSLQQQMGWRAGPPVRFDSGQGLSLAYHPTVNAVLDHVGIPMIEELTFHNKSFKTMRGLSVQISGGEFPYIRPWKQSIGDLRPDKSHKMTNIRVPIDHDTLKSVGEQRSSSLSIEVCEGEKTLETYTLDACVQPYSQWNLNPQTLYTLAAMVSPNAEAVQQIITRAAEIQKIQSGQSSFEGYQSGPKRVLEQVRALYEALGESGYKLGYINPPASFMSLGGDFGQKVRSAEQVLQGGRGTCLDLAVLLASLYEQIGLKAMLIIVPGHAYVGCWASEEHWGYYISRVMAGQVRDPLVADLCRDQAALQASFPDASLIAAYETPQRMQIEQAWYQKRWFWMINSVDMTQGGGLVQACASGMEYTVQQLMNSQQTEGYCLLIDLSICRELGITPLPGM